MRARGMKMIPVYCTAEQHKHLKEVAKLNRSSMSRMLLSAALCATSYR